MKRQRLTQWQIKTQYFDLLTFKPFPKMPYYALAYMDKCNCNINIKQGVIMWKLDITCDTASVIINLQDNMTYDSINIDQNVTTFLFFIIVIRAHKNIFEYC